MVFREGLKFVVLLSELEKTEGCWDNRTKLRYALEVPVSQEVTGR